MHHELVPAIASPTPGAELALAIGRVLLGVFVTTSCLLAVAGFLGGWFWVGVQLST